MPTAEEFKRLSLPRLEVARVIKDSLGVAGRIRPKLWLLGAIAASPMGVAWLLWGPAPIVARRPDAPLAAGLAAIAAVLIVWFQGAACHLAGRALAGGRPTLGRCLARGMRTFTGVLCINLVQALYLGAGAAFIVCVEMSLPRALPVQVSVGAVLALVMTMELPSICLAVPAFVIGGAGPLESLRSARELFEWDWWRMYVACVAALGASLAAVLLALACVRGALLTGGPLVSGAVAAAATAAALLPLTCAYCVLPVLYCRLRGLDDVACLLVEAEEFD